MIRYNTDCPYCHDIFDQYCNLFKGYKNCDKVDCEVLKMLKENERLKQENEQLKAQIEYMKCCKNCAHYETTEDYGSCRDKCAKKTKNGPWILTNWKLYKD